MTTEKFHSASIIGRNVGAPANVVNQKLIELGYMKKGEKKNSYVITELGQPHHKVYRDPKKDLEWFGWNSTVQAHLAEEFMKGSAVHKELVDLRERVVFLEGRYELLEKLIRNLPRA